VANWKILVNQWSNDPSFRNELSHHLVFTKNDEEPGCCGELCTENRLLRLIAASLPLSLLGLLAQEGSARALPGIAVLSTSLP
jgi:hypothetical protein